ncbi:MoaD/ThiS family protein [Winogradskyella ursingii]|uniref:MoaD/ThiS family protein n=1 Tax=Winogradskyella ursingii TaxID=2686079 RepID=UPI0015C79C64|nr:MoaD/ThiS family protein [Winogradskyella ursingii]
MKINYFGEIADITNKTSEELKLANPSVFELINHLKSKYDLVEEDIQIAINRNLISKDNNRPINKTDEVAILSAFAGG